MHCNLRGVLCYFRARCTTPVTSIPLEFCNNYYHHNPGTIYSYEQPCMIVYVINYCIMPCNIYLFFRFRALPRFVWATCLASTSISTTSSCYSRTIKKISAVRLSSAASQGYFYLLSICQPMDTKQETISVLELINFLLFWIYFFMFSLPSHDSLDPSYSFNSSSRTRWLSSIGRVLGISSAHYREDNARHQPTWSLKRYTSSNSYQRPRCWRYYLLSWL